MDSVDDIVQSIDNLWALASFLLLGIFALLWKYGGELIKRTREVQRVTEDVQRSIITNHGSGNLGDAVDRLTERLDQSVGMASGNRYHLNRLSKLLHDHIEEYRATTDMTHKKITHLSDRLNEHLGFPPYED